MNLTYEELRFWEQVFIACTSSGNVCNATYNADRAVERRRERFSKDDKGPYR